MGVMSGIMMIGTSAFGSTYDFLGATIIINHNQYNGRVFSDHYLRYNS